MSHTAHELERVKRAAIRRYGRFPNVLGVGLGTKYVGRVATDQHEVVQFYVRRKIGARRARHRLLPAFVYGRFRNGSPNRRKRIRTDVIEVGRITSACGSGSAITSALGLTRQKGRITVAFVNKASVARECYVVSCAHVLGDIDDATAIEPKIKSECAPSAATFATEVYCATQVDNAVDFDIALARVTPECSPVPDLIVPGTPITLTDVVPTDDVVPPLEVACTFPLSAVKKAVVGSKGASVTVEYEHGIYDVRHAWMLKADRPVKVGDSGGLVYKDDKAVGLLFATSQSSEGFAWFHPLEGALAHVADHVQFPLRCFDP